MRPSLYNPLWQEWIQKLSLMHSKFLKVFEFISILKLFPFMFTPKKLFKLPFKNTIIFDAAVPSVFFFFSFKDCLIFILPSSFVLVSGWLCIKSAPRTAVCTHEQSALQCVWRPECCWSFCSQCFLFLNSAWPCFKSLCHSRTLLPRAASHSRCSRNSRVRTALAARHPAPSLSRF